MEENIPMYTKDNIPFDLEFKFYKKRKLARLARIYGPFKVATREGTLECEDGYLALDSRGWPYPIAKEEVEEIYELVG